MDDAKLLKATDRAYQMVFKSVTDFFSIKAAYDLELFKILGDNPQDTETLAKATKSVPLRLEKFLVGLQQIGLVERHDNRWSLTEFAEQFFTPAGRHLNLTMTPFVEYFVGAADSYYSHLAKVVRGQLDFTSHVPHPPRTREDSIFYETLHRSNIHFTVKTLLEYAQLSDVQHLVDVGGGIGDIAAALCKQYPHLNVTLINLPSALDLVRENMVAHGLEQRVTPVALDMYREPYPQGDGILFSRILYPLDARFCQMLFQKAYDALNPGGRIFILDMNISDPEHPNYDYLTHYLGSVGLDFAPMVFKNQAVYSEVLQAVGFQNVRCNEAYEHVLYQAQKPL